MKRQPVVTREAGDFCLGELIAKQARCRLVHSLPPEHSCKHEDMVSVEHQEYIPYDVFAAATKDYRNR